LHRAYNFAETQYMRYHTEYKKENLSLTDILYVVKVPAARLATVSSVPSFTATDKHQTPISTPYEAWWSNGRCAELANHEDRVSVLARA
jgi:hypothetical protein